MTRPLFQPKGCNRREFLLASGIVVVGGLVSCEQSGKSPKQQVTKKTKILQVKNIPIRVRIGKNIHRVTIDGKVLTAKNIADDSKTIELSSPSEVKIDHRTKKITGHIVLHRRKDQTNTFDVVAHVPIEQYLPGVLAGELFAHWHPTTFIAQAVAARSYAVYEHLARKDASHFDVEDGPSSQMFLGEVTLDVAHRAAKESEGIVLAWNGEVIPAYYCACCGGVAATASDAISGAAIHNIPPLQGQGGVDVCTELDIHKWSAIRSSRTVRRRLNACAGTMSIPEFSSVRTIRSVKPSTTNKHGRPTSLAIYDRTNNRTEVRARDFIRAVNATISTLPKPTPTIWSSNLVAHKQGTNIQFEGTGMGHGVGLCQYGAQERAGKGESWEEILSWYYPKATISEQM